MAIRNQKRARLWSGSAMAIGLLGCASAADAEVIAHRLWIERPDSHYIEVESRFPATAQNLELMMAVWTPGSYLVREFSRHLESLSATDGNLELGVQQTAKNRWRIATGGASAVTVRYRVYARELTVRTSFVDSEFALVNPTTVFLVPADGLDRPHEIRLELPRGWRAHTALVAADGVYRARDFDELADSPLVFGRAEVARFEAREVAHSIVHVGDHRFWDLEQATADVARLVSRQLLFWGRLPSPRPYYFFNLITESGGGLEHAHSTVLMSSRWTMRRREDYVDWLNLVSHEYFHVWNVKRLRPSGLESYDYESENYARGLWLSEGFTSYYGPLLLTRAGLMTPTEFFKEMARRIRQLETRPGRFVSSTEQASFNAWIKHYRPDENSINSTVSYYNKGAILALLLDARIRQDSNGRHSLDDLMRDLYAAHADGEGFSTERVAALAAARAGADLDAWFARYVAGTDALDYDDALRWWGLELKREAEPEQAPDAFVDPARASLGLTVAVENGRVIVKEVPRESAAWHAGIAVEDELIAIDEVRVDPDPDAWKLLFGRLRIGDDVQIVLARRGRLRSLSAVLEAEIAEEWTLRRRPDLSEKQLNRLRRWLGRGWFLAERTTTN